MLLPKETKERIMRLLVGRKLTAGMIAKEININVSAVRKHLELLEKEKLVESSFKKGKVGRPKRVYFVSDDGIQLLYNTEENFLDILISCIEEMQEESTSDLLKKVARKLTENVTESTESFFRKNGFETKIEGNLVTTYSCPLIKLAKKHTSTFCKGLHPLLIEGLTGRKALLVQTMAEGREYCVHSFI